MVDNVKITSPEMAFKIARNALLDSVCETMKRFSRQLFDDMFGDNYARYSKYSRAWERVYKQPAQIVESTPFGFKDPFGLTKYYSETFSPYMTFIAGGPVVEGQPVYQHADGKVYPLTKEDSNA